MIYVFTHDSIGLGEDGPTHQPVEHLAAMRAIPNMVVIRPGDANESVVAWQVAIERDAWADGAGLQPPEAAGVRPDQARARRRACARARTRCSTQQGGEPEVLLLATGSEVALALEAQAELAKQGVRGAGGQLPQLGAVRGSSHRSIATACCRRACTARLSIEAGVGQGWHRWVGEHGDIMSIESSARRRRTKRSISTMA